MQKPSDGLDGRESSTIGESAEPVKVKPVIQLQQIDAEKIPQFVSAQRITERGSLELETSEGKFFARVLAVQPDPDAHLHDRDEWDPEHISYENLDFREPLHAHEHGADTTHGMVQLPWLSMKPGTRYAIAVMADEGAFGEPEEFTDEPNDAIGDSPLGRIKSLFGNSPQKELKSGTRTLVFAATVRIDGKQPLNVRKSTGGQFEMLAMIGRRKDDETGAEKGDGIGVFTGLVEDNGNQATTRPLIIEDAPSTLPGTGTPESTNGLTTAILYKTAIENVKKIKKVPNPDYAKPTDALSNMGYGNFGNLRGGGMHNFGEFETRSSFRESKTVFGKEEEEIEVNTVNTTGIKGMSAAFQFRIVVEEENV